MKFAEILFPKKVGQDSSTLTYRVPENSKLGQGVRTKIRNRDNFGIIWKFVKKPTFRTLPIQEITEENPLVPHPKLLEWISNNYFCPLFKVLKLFTPQRNLERKPFRTKEKIVQINSTSSKKLNKEQEQIISDIKATKENKILIQGVTGSGKTEVYTRIAQEQIKQGKQVLILVPEISLTTQIIEYFQDTLQIPAAIIHSKRSASERFNSWEKIWKNEAKLIIGSRSSIFSPFQNLGLIIMDEEHEYSYKQDSSPRYSTHKVAEKLLELNPQAKLIYGSATPSIETRSKTKTFFLNTRIGNKDLPQVEIVDLRQEFRKRNNSIFSESLHQAITATLERKEQVLLFLNRRGSASSIVCRDCGHSSTCPDCETKLTFHSRTLSEPSTICHHCGNISTPPKTCPECKSANIRYLGIGTQKIEAEVLKTFPQAKVLRADKDTTSTKNGFADIFKAFRNHEADILIGTQMIAKGLHLPKVSLVGVILADIGLNIPDFRSTERNFQLMTQVSGRAGRAETQGKVIIQTYAPESISLK
ncbi:primosomal protein N' [Candidatus Gracilibacteria bacterium]|nr:primosomal protein N' [Candidatus Gracilibacteria bacterium]